ncbi:hypothetical protein CASFOL_026846 [Castilleja foliolosa]|uniref:Uncharacterized protein n=1 Tax=Castilleja foliolosa TaxID=1961234 RepID=A0ABD3CJ89_9LAMI
MSLIHKSSHMAHIIPLVGPRDLPGNLAATGGFAAADIPTGQQIINETERLHGFERHRHTFGTLGVDNYSEALVRHHKILSLRADHEMGNFNFNHFQVQMDAQMAQLTAQTAQLAAQISQLAAQMAQSTAQLNARFDMVDARFDMIDAKMVVNSARIFNSGVGVTSGVNFHPLVKSTAGHPAPGPPLAVDGVHFQPAYAVGDHPPQNLLPANYDDLNGWELLGHVVLRRRLRAIYWFYNEPRLALAPRASQEICNRMIQTLTGYMTVP